jgi:hypothetical protein
VARSGDLQPPDLPQVQLLAVHTPDVTPSIHDQLMNGATGTSSTETGAYTLVGGQVAGEAPAVNHGATFYVPPEDQWYKAAYYKGRRHERGLLGLRHAERLGPDGGYIRKHRDWLCWQRWQLCELQWRTRLERPRWQCDDGGHQRLCERLRRV